MKNKTIGFVTNPLLQKVFIALCVCVYVFQAITFYEISIPMHLSDVYSDGLRLSSYFLLVLESMLLPLVLFVIAFYSIPKNKGSLQRVFESSFFTVMGLLLQIIIVQIVTIILDISKNSFDGSTILLPQLIPLLAVVLIYLLALLRYKRMRLLDSPLAIPPLQKTFIWLAGGAFVSFAVLIIYQIIQQYPSNPNVSAFLLTSLENFVLPSLLFVVAYITSSKGLLHTNRLFQASLFMVMGVMTLAVIKGLFHNLVPDISMLQNSFRGEVIYEFIVILILMTVYSIAIFYYRNHQAR